MFPGPRALDCLELHYHLDWPVNVVITDSCLTRYNMIFCFMLQLKRVAWCLNDIWYRLKRDGKISDLFDHLRLVKIIHLEYGALAQVFRKDRSVQLKLYQDRTLWLDFD